MPSISCSEVERCSPERDGPVSLNYDDDCGDAGVGCRRVKVGHISDALPVLSSARQKHSACIAEKSSTGHACPVDDMSLTHKEELSLLGSSEIGCDYVSLQDGSSPGKQHQRSVPYSASSVVDAVRSNNEFDLPGRLFGSRRTSSSVCNVTNSLVAQKSVVATSLNQARGSKPVSNSLHGAYLSPSSSSASPAGDAVARTALLKDCNIVTQGAYISDETFFSDVLFMWMGLEKGAHMLFMSPTHTYELAPNVGTESQRSAFRSFRELGALVRGMDAALQHGAMLESSFLQQSLRSALRHQLSHYMFFLASFRETQPEQRTLGDLVVAHQRVYPKICAMHTVLRETESVKGGELVSKLQFLIQQGSSRLSSLLSDIYIEAVSPLLFMVVCSITKGEVSDPFNEFFISVNSKIEDGADTFWTLRYSLSVSMLPTTISLELAKQILLVMKNVCFIRFCCRAKNWRMNSSVTAEANRSTFATLPRVVHSALSYSNTAVLSLLRGEFKLDDVFRHVNAFLLVSYGDFFDLLIGKLEPILSKLSQTIQVSFVNDQVNSALLEVAPYAKHLDTDRFFLIHSELIKDESKLGWDAFVLTMPFPAPLNSIFDLSATKIYRRLFRVLFRVKVAETLLKNAWRRSVVLDRIIGGLHRASDGIDAWRNVAADAHLLGLQLNHFIQNLWSYFVSEVSTVAWDLLMKAIDQCSSLDEVRVAHNAYLAHLTQRCLLHNECGYIRTNIENILTIVREYCGSQALLASLMERGAGDVNAIQQQYQALADDFHREMSSLLSGLEEQHHRFNFLNYLILRINFNSYYRDTSKGDNTDF